MYGIAMKIKATEFFRCHRLKRKKKRIGRRRNNKALEAEKQMAIQRQIEQMLAES
jgi:hypothetical protein